MIQTTFLLSFLFSLAAWAQLQDGIYQISGQHSDRGTYHGQLRIQGPQIEKLIQYDSFQFKGYSVQEIWTGQRDEQTQNITFQLKPSEVLTSFENFSFPAEAFQHPLIVTTTFDHLGNIEDQWLGHYTESYQFLSATTNPLWTSERIAVDVTGDNEPLVVKIAEWLVIDKIVKTYRQLEETKPWRNRPEWTEQKQYRYFDPTDFEFYRENTQVLRVANKILSPLSLAEALQKRNAYSLSLAQKALYFDQRAPSLNLNGAGLLEEAILDPATHLKSGSAPDHDSALWTSTYLLSQVLRFEATGSEEAYNNAKRMVEGLVTLVDITEAPNEFARTLAVSPDSDHSFDGDPNWIQGKGAYSQLKWKKGGNNDMAKGVLLGFILAHRFLRPTEVELIQRIRMVTPKLLKLEPMRDSGSNEAAAHGIAALWLNNSSQVDQFYRLTVNLKEVLASGLSLDTGFHVGGISDWSGIHLTSISNIIQILVAQEILKTSRNPIQKYMVRMSLQSAQKTLYRVWKGFRKARQGFVTILTAAFGNPDDFEPSFRKDLTDSLWVLRETPAPRKAGMATANLMIRSDWCLSAWPHQPWKAFQKPVLFAERKQGAYAYPLYEFLAWRSNYFWKDNPFMTELSADINREFSSIDYLLIYWAGRKAQILSPQD